MQGARFFLKHLMSVLFGVALGASLLQTAPAQAKVLDLLHTIPLEAQSQQPVTAADIMATLNAPQNTTADSLLRHMELLRRGEQSLSTAEKTKLLLALEKRYQQANNDPIKFFDHGYAQLVYLNNKTGLFFLRKANDRLKHPFTSLAYAMAQADVDLDQEKATPEAMTVRKLDAIHIFQDAVRRDAVNHQPGFWPSFVRVTQQLAALPAYTSFAKTDFSRQYVPYGIASGASTVSPSVTTISAPAAVSSASGASALTGGVCAWQLSAPPPAPANKPKSTASSPSASANKPIQAKAGYSKPNKRSLFSSNGIQLAPLGSSPVSPQPVQIASAQLTDAPATTVSSASPVSLVSVSVSSYVPLSDPLALKTMPVDLLGDGQLEVLAYYTEGPGYRIKVLSPSRQSIAELLSPTMNMPVEDLDGTGAKELVIRQYAQDPFHPVHVYRLKDCRYQLDEQIETLFK